MIVGGGGVKRNSLNYLIQRLYFRSVRKCQVMMLSYHITWIAIVTKW